MLERSLIRPREAGSSRTARGWGRVLRGCCLFLLAGYSLAGVVSMDLPHPEGTPTAENIAQQVYFVNHFQALSNISYGSKTDGMVLIRKEPRHKPRVLTLERHLNNRYDDGNIRARDLVIFRSGKLRGTGILVSDYLDSEKPLSFSLWLPELRKVRRHSAPNQGDTWGGSVFTYGDIYLRRPADESHELLDPAPFPECLATLKLAESEQDRFTQALPRSQCALKGRQLYRVKSTPVVPNWWYDYRIVWVDQGSFADYRSEYYKDGELIKVLDKAWRSMGLTDTRAQYWLYWYAKDLRTENEGMAYIREELVSWNNTVDPGRWTLNSLRKIRR